MNYTNFATYIKNLDINNYPPKALLNGIAQILRSNMRKRGLWNAPPVWLGYSDWENWNQDGAFNDLLLDCYLEVVVKRLDSLQNAIMKFDNIDGLIIRNVNNFLTDQQKSNNPINYGVAVNVKKAIQLAIESEKLIVQDLDKNGKIQDSTLLSFSSTQTTSTTDEISLLDCLRRNKAWAEIRLKLARKSAGIQTKFCEIVCDLANCGIQSFVFKELHERVKTEVRQYNEHLNYQTSPIDDFKDEALLGVVELDITHEDWESWKSLVNQVEKRIAQEPQKRVRERLEKIFREYVNYSKTDEPVPSQAEMARRLGIPSSTFSEDMKIIRAIIDPKN